MSVQRVLFFLTPCPQPKAYCINVDTWIYCIAEQTHGYFFNIAKFMYGICFVFWASYYFDAFEADTLKEIFLHTADIST